MAVHTTINGLTRDQLIEALKTERDCGKDIKEVWSQWGHQPGKPELAHALWPILAAKIARCRTDPDAPVPEIAEVIMTRTSSRSAGGFSHSRSARSRQRRYLMLHGRP